MTGEPSVEVKSPRARAPLRAVHHTSTITTTNPSNSLIGLLSRLTAQCGAARRGAVYSYALRSRGTRTHFAAATAAAAARFTQQQEQQQQEKQKQEQEPQEANSI